MRKSNHTNGLPYCYMPPKGDASRYYAFTAILALISIIFMVLCFHFAFYGNINMAGIMWGICAGIMMWAAWRVIKRECL